jgi:hypothetical protein
LPAKALRILQLTQFEQCLDSDQRRFGTELRLQIAPLVTGQCSQSGSGIPVANLRLRKLDGRTLGLQRWPLFTELILPRWG